MRRGIFSAAITAFAGLLCVTSCTASPDQAKESLAAGQDYKVEYLYFCGLPGRFTRRTCTLRSADLTPEDDRRLRKLINESQIATIKESDLKITDGGPARKITLNTGSVTKSVNWSYDYAPSSMRKLAEYLDSKSKEEKVP